MRPTNPHSPNRHPFGLLLALGLLPHLAAGVAAQRQTWIVDAAGGAGAHATTLQAGEALAAAGDVVLVRPGSYEGFATSKGITVVGLGAVTITTRLVFAVTATVYVSNLPVTETFALVGVTVMPAWAHTSTVSVENTGGRVILDRVHVPNPITPGLTGRIGVELRNAAHVYVRSCVLVGSPPLYVVGSTRCFCCDVDATGHDALVFFSQRARAAVALQMFPGCEVQWTRGALRGGSGQGNPQTWESAAPAIRAERCQLRVTGDASTTIACGSYDPINSPVPAIGLVSANLDIDPTVVLRSIHGAPAISGGPVTQRRIVSLQARGGDLGGLLNIEVDTPAGEFVAVFIGLPDGPFNTPIGEQHISLATLTTVAAGVQGASGRFPVALAIPAFPGLQGLTLAVQGFTATIGGGQFENSSPALVTIR